MRVKLARVEAVLQQLRSQRAVLQARLKTARAREGVSGGSVPSHTLRELQSHPMAFAVPAALFGIAGLVIWLRFGGTPDEASFLAVPENLHNRIAEAKSLAAEISPVAANNSLERRFSLSGDGKLAVVAQHRRSASVTAPSTTGQPVEPALTIWDLQSGRQIGELQSGLSATDVVMSRDGSLVAGIGRNIQTGKSAVCIWEVSTGHSRTVIESADFSEASRIGISPDGRSAYVTLGNPLLDTLGFIDCASGGLEKLHFSDVVQTAACAAFSPTRNIGVFAVEAFPEFGGPSLHVYDLTARRLTHSIRPASGRRADALAFSGEGELLAVTTNGKIQIFETNLWSETKILQGAEIPSHRIAVSSDGRYVAQARPGSIELWKPQTEVVTRLTPQSESLDIQFGDNDTLVVVSPSDRFTFFDSSTGQEILGLVRDER